MDFERLGSKRFLLLGRAGLDLYADPPGARTEDSARFTSALGGSAANIAAGIARLGGSAAIATAVSDDAVGRFTLNQLERYGIGIEHVASVAGEARTSLAVVETRRENCQSVIYRNNAADFQITAAEIDRIDLEPFGAMIMTGTCFAAEPSRAAHFRALERARANGLPIVFDVDYRPYSWTSAAEAADILRRAANSCDIVVGNDAEFAVMADDAGLAFAEELANTSAHAAIYKMGERGSIAFSAGRRIDTPIFAVTALKPTCAGDAFLSAFVMSLASGDALDVALSRGSASAALVVTRVGCAPAMPTENELAEFLRARRNKVSNNALPAL